MSTHTERIREKAWQAGNRAAWTRLLNTAIAALGGTTRTMEGLLAEREAAIVALRDLCESHGDNDWSNDLHLADVIEKHLGRHLEG